VIINRLRPRFGRAEWRRTALFVGLSAAIAAAACDDPFAPTATTAVRTDSFIVYSVSQTPVNAPSAFNIVFFTPLRLEPTYGFDLVFDLDASGKVVIIPVRLVGGALTATRVVGLRRITTDYDQLTIAPTSGYVYDSTMTLAMREGAVVQLQSSLCQYQVSQTVYAKMRILSVDVAKRLIGFEITYDPNCGFRSFKPGVPTE
jgi:hypothetical protein